MILLTDNDMILKLGACDLLDIFPAVCGGSKDEVMVLPTAKFVLRSAQRNKDKIEKYSAVGLRRALDFAEASHNVEQCDDKAQLALEKIEQVDPGEAILYAAAFRTAGAIVASGDKQALRALADAKPAQRIVKRLRGRVLCFEQAVLRCVAHLDFSDVKRRILPAAGCDGALKAVFISAGDVTEAVVREKLKAYINKLRAQTGSLLIPDAR